MHPKRLTWLVLLSLVGCGQPLLDAHDLAADITSQPTPGATEVAPSPTPTVSPAIDTHATPTPTPTPTTSVSPTSTPTPSPTPTPTVTPSPIPTNAQGLFAPEDVAYTIVANGSGMALDLTSSNGTSSANGTPVVQSTLISSPTQRWMFTLLTPGIYEIVNAGTQKCIDVLNDLTVDGTLIQEWECLGQPNQQWTITAVGGGLFVIKANTGSCLDIRNNSTLAGAQAIERTCISDVDQVWAIRYAP